MQNYFAKLKIKELNFCKAISKLNNIAHSSKGRYACRKKLAFPFLFYPPKMPVLSKHLYFKLSRILLFSILLLGLTQELFALPLKTTILNPEKQPVGRALVYIDYIELQELDGTPLGRLGFVNLQGGFQMFVVRDDGKQSLVGSAKNRRLFDKDGKLIGHYDWTTFWSYVYAPDGTKLGKAKCIAFRGICAAGIASFLTGLLDQ